MLLFLLGMISAVTARQVLNFDFAWRYAEGVEPRDSQCSYEQGVNYGRGYIWQGATASYQECCSECANRPTCKYVKDDTALENGCLS